MRDSIADYAERNHLETLLRTEIVNKREELVAIRQEIASNLADLDAMIDEMDRELAKVDW